MASKVWYRIVGRQRTGRDDVLKSTGGRFHDNPEAEPTSYLADSLTTAWREVTAGLGRVPPAPEAFRAYRVRLAGARLADLRAPLEQARHLVTEAELAEDPAPPKLRELSRKLRQRGSRLHGLIYRSVRNPPDGVCLALFLERADELIALEPVEADEWKAFLRGLGVSLEARAAVSRSSRTTPVEVRRGNSLERGTVRGRSEPDSQPPRPTFA